MESPNPTNVLPYVIIFAILFLITLCVLTWVLDVFYKSYNCNSSPNIWCYDTWTCHNNCPDNYPVNECFKSIGSTGLASCLYSAGATGASVCFNIPDNTTTSCNCPSSMQGNNVVNCLNNCPNDLNNLSSPVCCCNDPNNPKCLVDSNGNGIGLCSINSSVTSIR